MPRRWSRRSCTTDRRACRVLGQGRSTQRRSRHVASDEARLIMRGLWTWPAGSDGTATVA
jgi:hypothetical protein